jgi:hypothetical protein
MKLKSSDTGPPISCVYLHHMTAQPQLIKAERGVHRHRRGLCSTGQCVPTMLNLMSGIEHQIRDRVTDKQAEEDLADVLEPIVCRRPRPS